MASDHHGKGRSFPPRPPSSPFPPGVYLTKKEKQEMMKPLIFPNSERKFKWFTYVFSGGIMAYLVLFHNFGPHDHCFRPVRQFCKSLVHSFYQIDPDDKDYVEKRKQELAAQLQESITKEQKLAEEMKANPARVFTANPQKGGFNRIDLDPEELER